MGDTSDMGVFDAIGDALSGKPQASPRPKPSRRAPASGDGGGLDVKARDMCRNGVEPRDYGINYDCAHGPGTTSSIDAAMQRHADKVHPVK